MRSAFALSLAALAGSALAVPAYQGYPAEQPAQNGGVVVETVLHTVYVTEGTPEATPCETSATAAATPVYESQPPVYQIETPKPVSSAPAYTPAPAPTTTPEPTPEPTPTPTPTPQPSTGGYMDVVAEWRSKLGLKPLEYSALLESNALNVVIEGNGQMKHKLNPGTYGQVLAPGKADDFENVFVGGWLCEIPTLAGLGDSCQQYSKGWDYQGQTGHADILTSPNYSKIGCSEAVGIWCCDLA